MHHPRIRRASVWLSVLALMVIALAAQANNNGLPLSQAALHSPNASKSLLLDITRIGERLITVGEQGHILYSDTDGKQWEHANVPVSLMLTAVDFPSDKRGWAVGHDGVVLVSDDRGATWQIQLDGRDIAKMQQQAAKARVTELGLRLQQTTEASEIPDAQDALTDAEYNLEDIELLQNEGINTPLLGVTFISDLTGFAYGAYGLLLFTEDGGEQWSLRSDRLGNVDKYHLYDLAVSKNGLIVLSGEAGTVYRSEDQGSSWQRLPIDYTGSLFGIVSTPENTIITFGLRGKIFRSVDNGNSWSSITSAGQKTLTGGKILANGRVVLVGASGTVLDSRDDGLSFKLVDSGSRDVFSNVATNADGELLVAGFGGIKTIRNSHNN